jgi:hypothetical protein
MRSPRRVGGYRYLAVLAGVGVVLVLALILWSAGVSAAAYGALAALVALALLIHG